MSVNASTKSLIRVALLGVGLFWIGDGTLQYIELNRIGDPDPFRNAFLDGVPWARAMVRMVLPVVLVGLVARMNSGAARWR